MQDYSKIGEQVKKLYDADYSRKYRGLDEVDQNDDFHRHVINQLASISSSFDHPISVLDIGCGTGRHFYGLTNVRKLTGVDISRSMINEAAHPLNGSRLDIQEKEFIVGNVFEQKFQVNSFDFIYSIGVLAEHSPLDKAILEKVYNWLKPNGVFYFTAVDASSKWQRIVVDFLFPILPFFFKRKLNYPRKSFYLFRTQLEKIISRSEFSIQSIRSIRVNNPKWKGAHFECSLMKC